MRLLILAIVLNISLTGLQLHSQPLKLNWQHCYGGSNYENGYNIIKGTGGFILFCGTDSHDGDVTGFHGGYGDYWLIKTDTAGNLVWNKTYGGIDQDDASYMKQTSDGGFILFGDAFSNSGEVVGNHGGSDFWLVKVDSLGNIEWTKCLGGSCNDAGYKIDLTQDGGFVCIGSSCSHDGDVTTNYGNYDVWVVRLSQTGDIIWQKSFGGTFTDWGISIKSTSDKGAIIGGLIGSSDGNIQCNYRNFDDCWVSKLDSSGNIEWQNCYGGTGNESVVDIIPTDDGGYIFNSGTNSTDGDISGNHGDYDFWVVKLDHMGNLEWQKCFGGSSTDRSYVIKKSSDGNYLVGGYTLSNDGDVHGNHSLPPNYSDMWLIKISPLGDLLWQQCFGGDDSEGINDILELNGGTIMLLGGAQTSDNSGDVQCNHHGPGTNDVWLLSVTDTTYVGINDKKGRLYNIWTSPNPADENVSFNITGPDFSTDTKIMVFNNCGQKIQILSLKKGEKSTLFDCHSVVSGLYYYTYINNLFSGAGKIIISH